MENIFAVSNKIIQTCNERNIHLGQMKLQKLLYFMQGWYLSLYDKPLFDEDFEAWECDLKGTSIMSFCK